MAGSLPVLRHLGTEEWLRAYDVRVCLRLLIACALACTVIARGQGSAAGGTICGTLYDENGQPSAATGVAARYIGPHSGPYPAGKTDASGHYCLKGVSFGEYVLYASDEGKGYPDQDTQFYAPHSPESRVTLSAANPNGKVDGHIPYKAGFLTINLTESGTGKPLKDMAVDLALRSDPEHRYMHMSTSSDQILLVPPNEDVYIDVTSLGFETWPHDGSKGVLLSFLPGQKRVLTVSLRRADTK